MSQEFDLFLAEFLWLRPTVKLEAHPVKGTPASIAESGARASPSASRTNLFLQSHPVRSTPVLILPCRFGIRCRPMVAAAGSTYRERENPMSQNLVTLNLTDA